MGHKRDPKQYILSLGDYVLLEDLVDEYHILIHDFLHRYQAVLFDANALAFKEVLSTLLSLVESRPQPICFPLFTMSNTLANIHSKQGIRLTINQ